MKSQRLPQNSQIARAALEPKPRDGMTISKQQWRSAATRLNRRAFMRYAAALSTGVWIGGSVSAEPTKRSPNEKLNLGFIGVGGRGWNNLQSLYGENVVALCDVDSGRAAEAFTRFSRVPKYRDFRQMLDRERSLDAVVISTPDHTHAVAARAALQLHMHVYCEKPLVHDMGELDELVRLAARANVATQMGTQGTALTGLAQAAEAVQRGDIGDVREAHVWTNRPGDYWKQGLLTPHQKASPPASLDWDLWLGPAPERAYDPGYVPFAWRGWRDFGTGALGDMGCHTLNLPWKALRLGSPLSVNADTSQPAGDSYPLSSTVHFDFAPRGTMGPVRLTWYDGGRLPPTAVAPGVKLPKTGAILIGSKATLLSPGDYGARSVILEGSQQKRIANSVPPLETPRHYTDWLRACRGGAPAAANFGAVASLVELVLLGNIAVQMGRPLRWHSAKRQFTNCPPANDLLARQYRIGWR
jgi:predicted dehydrogenase